jgi:hypothetical protein
VCLNHRIMLNKKELRVFSCTLSALQSRFRAHSARIVTGETKLPVRFGVLFLQVSNFHCALMRGINRQNEREEMGFIFGRNVRHPRRWAFCPYCRLYT